MLLPNWQQLSVNTMRRPSGDQPGQNASSDGRVIRCRPVPSERITHSALSKPPRSAPTTMRRPSGEYWPRT